MEISISRFHHEEITASENKISVPSISSFNSIKETKSGISVPIEKEGDSTLELTACMVLLMF